MADWAWLVLWDKASLACSFKRAGCYRKAQIEKREICLFMKKDFREMHTLKMLMSIVEPWELHNRTYYNSIRTTWTKKCGYHTHMWAKLSPQRWKHTVVYNVFVCCSIRISIHWHKEPKPVPAGQYPYIQSNIHWHQCLDQPRYLWLNGQIPIATLQNLLELLSRKGV